MASLSKLYLRNTPWTALPELSPELAPGGSGTAPGNTTLDAATPTVTALDAPTNLALTSSAGTAQVQVDITTLAQTAAQSAWLARFVSPPLATQTIGAQSVSLSGAFSESAAQSDFRPSFGLYLWRPSDGTLVATMLAVGGALATEPTTTQTAGTATGTTAAATATAGDVLVLEVWRASGTQTNATARTNSIYYNGTTEGSTTSNAAYLSFATAVVIPSAYQSAQTASASLSGSLSTTYTPAPRGLTVVHTHTE